MKYHRRSIRMDNFDYSKDGFYFVTVCCQNRKNIFGEIDVGAGLVPAQMIKNDIGKLINEIILEYFNKNELIELDEFIIMPDHIHMIVVIKKQFNNEMGNKINNEMNNKINNGVEIKMIVGDEIKTRAGTTNNRATTRVAPTLGTIVGELKSLITNEYIKNIKQNNWPRFDKRLWQRNYYERIIRNEKEYLIYKKYIKDNPINI
ncbi:MAG: hypothetical protein PHP97_02655 [Candidatus Shapirobacteria bacterium]|nr:hypothetical protein [Candidatus Shapirobacteria bacterium]MDD3002266.1 hypothetical protein [Candidatus Shapirobacteria bacterium]MDD4382729.1 hypothetical protein [Candidatus Shapirobacteria bacterium]